MKKLLIVFVLGLIEFVPAGFSEELKLVSLQSIHPTQPAVGSVVVDLIKKSKFKDVTDEKSLHDILAKQKAMRAVIGPQGIVFLTDGHHRTTAAYRTAVSICQDNQQCMQKTQVKVSIEADLSSSSWEEFSNFMMSTNNVYLPAAMRSQVEAGQIRKEMILKDPDGILPHSLGELGNDPMRSAMSEMFKKQKPAMDGDLFVNYVEFHLGERVAQQVSVVSGHELDDDVIESLKNVVFLDPDNLHFFRCLARRDEASWVKAQDLIDQAVGEVRSPDHPAFSVRECE